MATSSGASTPTATPQRPIQPTTTPTTAQRSFTLPPKLPPTTTRTKTSTSASPSSPKQTQDSSYEILFTHPNTQVIKFKSTLPAPNPSNRTNATSAKIPWTSPTEVTSASGHLEIYRVRGSVSFIRSGSFLLQLLPRSQCWCVDGGGKFAFRAREAGTFYRVELPTATEEEREKVEMLKGVLASVIFYERGACPFERGDGTAVVVDDGEAEREGEMPDLARRKKRRSAEGRARAKRWHLDRAYGWKPEGWEPGMDEEVEEGAERSASGSGSSAAGSEEEEEEEEGDVAEVEDRADVLTPPSARQKALQALRSASASHSQQAQVPHQPSRLKARMGVDGATAEPDASSETSITAAASSSSSSALRTFQPIPTDMPPSPPDSSAGLDYSETRVRFENAAVDGERVGDVAGVEGLEVSGDADANDDDHHLLEDVPVDGRDVDNDVEEGDLSVGEGVAGVRSQDLDEGAPAAGEIIPEEDVRNEDPIMRNEDVREVAAAESSEEVEEDKLDGTSEDITEESDESDKEIHAISAKLNQHNEYAQEAGVTNEDTPDETEGSVDRAIAARLSVEDEDEEVDTKRVEFTVSTPPHETQLDTTTAQSTQEPDEPTTERTPTPPTPQLEPPSSDSESTSPSTTPQQPTSPTSSPARTTSSEDPYAAIQARILARRSLSGTTSFHPLHKSPTRSSISSTSSSSATMISNAASRTSRARSHQHQHHGSDASSLVTRAYSVFLGPPTHLVQIMLRIASRFASGTFGVNGMFYSESPPGSPRKVPGGYYYGAGAARDGVEEVDVDVAGEEEEEEEGWEDREDDFGVPLHLPVVGGLGGDGGVRERERRGRGGGGDVD